MNPFHSVLKSKRRLLLLAAVSLFVSLETALGLPNSSSISNSESDSDPCAPLVINYSQPSGLGDLTVDEVRRIQEIVDRVGREIVVVGSAARGERRNRGTNLPFEKGPTGRSDIDYVMPLGNRITDVRYAEQFIRLHREVLYQLPDLDTGFGHGGVMIRVPPENNRIWFSPAQHPEFLPAGQPNRTLTPWVTRQTLIAFLRNEIDFVNSELQSFQKELNGLRNPRSRRANDLRMVILAYESNVRLLQEELDYAVALLERNPASAEQSPSGANNNSVNTTK